MALTVNIEFKNNITKMEGAHGIQVLNSTATLNTKETFTSKIVIDSGKTFERSNTVIRYEASESPMFEVHGTLKLINCTVILSNPVDLIYISGGNVYLKNVTITNLSEGTAGSLFQADSGSLYIEGFEAYNFVGANLWDVNNLYLSNLNISITDSIRISDSNNVTLINSAINFLYQPEPGGSVSQTRLIELSSVKDAKIINNTINIPVEALEFYSAFLEALCLNIAENVVVKNNRIVNGGKIIVTYDARNILIANNTLLAEKLVEGSELQIDQDSENITIINNTISMFWEGIEIYSHSKITVKNNTVYDCDTAIKIEPINWNGVADVVVEGNKFINSNVLVFYTIGVTLKNNFFENLEIVIMDSKNITLKMCTLKNSTVYLEKYSENITIIDNTIYVETGREWLKIEENVKNVFVDNNTIIEIEDSSGETVERETPSTGEETQDHEGRELPFFVKIVSIAVIVAIALLLVGLKIRKGS